MTLALPHLARVLPASRALRFPIPSLALFAPTGVDSRLLPRLQCPDERGSTVSDQRNTCPADRTGDAGEFGEGEQGVDRNG